MAATMCAASSECLLQLSLYLLILCFQNNFSLTLNAYNMFLELYIVNSFLYFTVGLFKTVFTASESSSIHVSLSLGLYIFPPF